MSYLTDTEKRILFSALSREKQICQEDKYLADLGPIIESLERKFFNNRFEKEIQEEAIKDFANWIGDYVDGYYPWAVTTEKTIEAFHEHKKEQNTMRM